VPLFTLLAARPAAGAETPSLLPSSLATTARRRLVRFVPPGPPRDDEPVSLSSPLLGSMFLEEDAPRLREAAEPLFAAALGFAGCFRSLLAARRPRVAAPPLACAAPRWELRVARVVTVGCARPDRRAAAPPPSESDEAASSSSESLPWPLAALPLAALSVPAPAASLSPLVGSHSPSESAIFSTQKICVGRFSTLVNDRL